MAGQEGGFNPVDYMARLAAVNGANGGGGAASGGGGGGAHAMSPTHTHSETVQNSHLMSTIEAGADALMGQFGLSFGKTGDWFEAQSVKGGLFGVFNDQQAKYLGILSDTQGMGGILATLSKYVVREVPHEKYDIPNVWSAGGAAVDTHVAITGDAISAPPATPGVQGAPASFVMGA